MGLELSNVMDAIAVLAERRCRFNDDAALRQAAHSVRPARLGARISSAIRPSNASFEVLPGASFTTNGAPIPRDLAATRAGAQYLLSTDWSVIACFYAASPPAIRPTPAAAAPRYTW
jgi:hypothetical protein